MKKYLIIISITVLLAISFMAQAAYELEVKIPGVEQAAPTLAQYLRGIFIFLISAAGIITMLTIMIGGYQYMTAAGNTTKIEDAKSRIKSAIMGLVLALASYMILYMINPDLVALRMPGGPKVSFCEVSGGKEGIKESDCTYTKMECRPGTDAVFYPKKNNCCICEEMEMAKLGQPCNPEGAPAIFCDYGLKCDAVSKKCVLTEKRTAEQESGKYRWLMTTDCSGEGIMVEGLWRRFSNYDDTFCLGEKPEKNRCCGEYPPCETGTKWNGEECMGLVTGKKGAKCGREELENLVWKDEEGTECIRECQFCKNNPGFALPGGDECPTPAVSEEYECKKIEDCSSDQISNKCPGFNVCCIPK